MAAFMGMLGLEFVGGVIAGLLLTWDVTGSEASGYNLGGALAVGLGIRSSSNYSWLNFMLL